MGRSVTITGGLDHLTSPTTDNVDGWLPVGASVGTQTVETRNANPWPVAGTFDKFGVYVASYAAPGTADFELWDNGAGTGLGVSAIAATGTHKDTTNTAVVDGTTDISIFADLDAYGGGSAFASRVIWVEFEPDDPDLTVCQLATGGGANVFATDSVTRYHAIAGKGDSTVTSSTEGPVQTTLPTGGTLHNLYCHVQTNGRTTNTVATLRVNGADTSVTVTITGSATGVFEDVTNATTVANGDLLAVKSVTSTGGGSTTCYRTFGVFLSTDDRTSVIAGTTSGASIAATIHRYWSVAPGSTAIGARANSEFEVSYDCEVANLNVRVSSNTSTGSSTVFIHDDGSDTAVGVTFTTGQTGWKVDTDKATVAAGSKLTLHYNNAGASGSVTFTSHSFRMRELVTTTVTPSALSVAATPVAPAVALSFASGATDIPVDVPTPDASLSTAAVGPLSVAARPQDPALVLTHVPAARSVTLAVADPYAYLPEASVAASSMGGAIVRLMVEVVGEVSFDALALGGATGRASILIADPASVEIEIGVLALGGTLAGCGLTIRTTGWGALTRVGTFAPSADSAVAVAPVKSVAVWPRNLQ
ncbi:MAG: hypothetical protein EKK62_09510 [Acidimicrobiia bacterium]|nr:MAG: hypothetical protein EKK62_09510 [Acidimicrobiia bacterium]